ncbi:MAG: glycerophosphodiester phosphodiesterase family protein [Pseudomonadota bacterium]
MIRFVLPTMLVLLTTSCAQRPLTPQSTDTVATLPSAAEWLDCLRKTGGTIVSAHRGGPYPGYPENALETIRFVLDQAPNFPEIDISTSADGTLFLFHDDALDAKTTGRGLAAKTSWETLRSLKLVDEAGAISAFNPVTLDDALRALTPHTIVELDLKAPTQASDIVAAVQAQNLSHRVIYIAYNLEQALQWQRLDPLATVSLSVFNWEDWRAVQASAIDLTRAVAFMAFSAPDPTLIEALHARGVEVIFGTLGWENSIDDQIAAGTAPYDYRDLAALGVQIIATDRPIEASADLPPTQCGAPAEP